MLGVVGMGSLESSYSGPPEELARLGVGEGSLQRRENAQNGCGVWIRWFGQTPFRTRF